MSPPTDDGLYQGRVSPPNGARRIWSGRGDRGRHWTSGARNYGTWRHYGALKQATQPRFSSFRCQLNLSGGALAGKNAFLFFKIAISIHVEIDRSSYIGLKTGKVEFSYKSSYNIDNWLSISLYYQKRFILKVLCLSRILNFNFLQWRFMYRMYLFHLSDKIYSIWSLLKRRNRIL